jgi:hypothetical protein
MPTESPLLVELMPHIYILQGKRMELDTYYYYQRAFIKGQL